MCALWCPYFVMHALPSLHHACGSCRVLALSYVCFLPCLHMCLTCLCLVLRVIASFDAISCSDLFSFLFSYVSAHWEACLLALPAVHQGL